MENNYKYDPTAIYIEPLLNVSQVAHQLHISRSFAYLLMQSGAIPTVHLGKSRRVRHEDLEKYIIRNVHSIKTVE